MNTLDTFRLTFDGSLLESERNTPPEGAGFAKVMGKFACWPGGTVRLTGRIMSPETVTLAVVSARFGSALAWIAVEPAERPVTGTFTVVAPAPKVAVAGTVAAAELLELRLTVTPPAGAGPDSVSVRFWMPDPIVRTAGVKAIMPVTCAVWLPEV